MLVINKILFGNISIKLRLRRELENEPNVHHTTNVCERQLSKKILHRDECSKEENSSTNLASEYNLIIIKFIMSDLLIFKFINIVLKGKQSID